MKDLPLPSDLPLSVQIVFWILTGLLVLTSGLSMWFLLRYVSRRDETEKGLNDKSEQLTDKFNTLNQELRDTISNLRLAGSQFQSDIRAEISVIKNSGIQIDATLKDALRLAEELARDFDSISTKVEETMTSIELHNQRFMKTAKALKRLDDEVYNIKTVLKKAGHDLVIVSQKKINEGE